MRRYALLAALLVGACAGSDALDARMKPMVGANEPALLAAMGRAPDASTEPAPGTKLLQWRWQRRMDAKRAVKKRPAMARGRDLGNEKGASQ